MVVNKAPAKAGNSIDTIFDDYDTVKGEAAHVLCDEIWELEKALETMGFEIQDIEEKYFEHFNPDNKEHHFGIVLEFKRYRAKAFVVSELQCNCNKILKELKALAQKAMVNNVT